jgi:hypothetical protein
MNPDDPRLEASLREALGGPNLPDDGFTNRVLAALPPRRDSHHRHRAVLAIAWTVSGSGIASALCIVGTTDWAGGVLGRLADSATLLTAQPWITFAVTVAFLSYLGGLYAARAAIGSLGRSR